MIPDQIPLAIDTPVYHVRNVFFDEGKKPIHIVSVDIPGTGADVNIIVEYDQQEKTVLSAKVAKNISPQMQQDAIDELRAVLIAAKSCLNMHLSQQSTKTS